MASRNDGKQGNGLMERLLATFRTEADEHLGSMSSGLMALEQTPRGAASKTLIETIFRDAHSLKGAARAVNLESIEAVCQSLESVFAAIKAERLAVTPSLLNVLHESLDVIRQLLAMDSMSQGRRPPLVASMTRRLDEALQDMSTDMHTVPEPIVMHAVADPPAVLPSLAPETVRVSVAKLDTVMHHVEELLAPRLAAGQRAQELRETATMFATWRKQRVRLQPVLRLIERAALADSRQAQQAVGHQDQERYIATDSASGKRRELPRLLEYLDSEQLHMKVLEDRLAQLCRAAEHDQRTLANMADSLLHDCKEMQLLPFSSLLEGFPRFVRELAREQGKNAELVLQGGEIEIDRRILDAIKDPLIHLLRNSIDHGFAKPAERVAKGKSPQGRIIVAVSQKDSGKVEVLLADDGGGIDTASVKAAAGRLGTLSAQDAERVDEQEALMLIFKSGISTSPIITDVSGHGLGLAIVREKVERLGGSVAIESRRDEGTTFRIVLPLMLANVHGVIVRVGEQLFVIPVIHVARVARVVRGDVRTVENRETIALDGEAISLIPLSDVLELKRSRTDDAPADAVLVVVVSMARTRMAFQVDEILGEHEVLVKPLGRQLARIRNVAGACVLGTGRVVLVLNASDLLKSAVKHATAPRLPADRVPGEKSAKTEKQSILVVEDSITSRSLLKGILETAGYRVSTAVDGVDGYTTLRTGNFDLVVSDVEMPRMDGFDLTAKLRADEHLMNLPVVLVTALGSREDRERGIDVGANAYIVKSSFDQSNLLEVIRRLV
ncbi:response regulator [Dyella flava]|uniref:histidine kinase n=1 Tax=Dyella flava TaxID=1920170 RepID=A0ABS2K0F9_9GAMM|nr:hybrid sensor histidine kinase/response regulator [Dyella flava]MBM7124736.1 hybrid sensor histidine kinase/response regulator [Dyella flava]GLQ50781.1 transcriptional regulator [Dyella flava]